MNWSKMSQRLTTPLWPSGFLKALECEPVHFPAELAGAVRWYYSWVTVRFCLAFLAVDVLAFKLWNYPLNSWTFGLSLLLVYFVALHLVNRLVYKDSKQFQMMEYIVNINRLEHEDAGAADAASARRAELLLKNHELTLQRYYAQNLTQNSMVFWSGMVCILLGFGLTVWSLQLIFGPAAKPNGVAPAVTAMISGIVLNLVAGVMLTMYRGVESSLKVFHERIVATHHCYLAHFLACQVPPGSERNKALAKLSEDVLRFGLSEKGSARPNG